MASQLTETDERIYIDNIPPLEWGKLHDGHGLNHGEQLVENYIREGMLLGDLLDRVLPSFDHGHKEWAGAISRKQEDTLKQILGIEGESIGFMTEGLKSFELIYTKAI